MATNNAKAIQGAFKHGLYAVAGGTFGILVGFGGGLVIATVGAAAGITGISGLTPTALLAVETVIGLGLGTLGGALVSYMEDMASA
jgi:hypothetical protein